VEETIQVMQFTMQLISRFVKWMFVTPLVPGFSIGIVTFGTMLIAMGTRFVQALLAKKETEKDA